MDKLAYFIGQIVGLLIAYLFNAIFVQLGYNAIALNFNLPQFDYWSCFFILLAITFISNAITLRYPKKKED